MDDQSVKRDITRRPVFAGGAARSCAQVLAVDSACLGVRRARYATSVPQFLASIRKRTLQGGPCALQHHSARQDRHRIGG
jgi:hypothetical protein